MRKKHSFLNARIHSCCLFSDQYLNNYAVIRMKYHICKARDPHGHKVEAERIVRA